MIHIQERSINWPLGDNSATKGRQRIYIEYRLNIKINLGYSRSRYVRPLRGRFEQQRKQTLIVSLFGIVYSALAQTKTSRSYSCSDEAPSPVVKVQYYTVWPLEVDQLQYALENTFRRLSFNIRVTVRARSFPTNHQPLPAHLLIAGAAPNSAHGGACKLSKQQCRC